MATVPTKQQNSVPTIHPLSSRVVDAVSQIEDALLEVSQTTLARTTLPRTTVPEQAFLPLSVVIPVFNERNTIQDVIECVVALSIDKQIIVVDDGSTDGTREILANYVGRHGIEIVLHPCNQGKGAALKSGFDRAQGEVVIVQDADLEYDPQDILAVIQPVLDGECDVCYGSRYLDANHQDPSALHRFGNWLLTQFSNWMTSHSLTDMETCYKAIRRSVLTSIVIEQRRFGFEPEITAKLARAGHRIVEVPVSYKSRSWSEGKKIGVRDLINTLWCIVRYRFR